MSAPRYPGSPAPEKQKKGRNGSAQQNLYAQELKRLGSAFGQLRSHPLLSSEASQYDEELRENFLTTLNALHPITEAQKAVRGVAEALAETARSPEAFTQACFAMHAGGLCFHGGIGAVEDALRLVPGSLARDGDRFVFVSASAPLLHQRPPRRTRRRGASGEARTGSGNTAVCSPHRGRGGSHRRPPSQQPGWEESGDGGAGRNGPRGGSGRRGRSGGRRSGQNRSAEVPPRILQEVFDFAVSEHFLDSSEGHGPALPRESGQRSASPTYHETGDASHAETAANESTNGGTAAVLAKQEAEDASTDGGTAAVLAKQEAEDAPPDGGTAAVLAKQEADDSTAVVPEKQEAQDVPPDDSTAAGEKVSCRNKKSSEVSSKAGEDLPTTVAVPIGDRHETPHHGFCLASAISP